MNARRAWIAVATLAAVVTTTAVAVLPQQSGQVDLLSQANVRIDGAATDDFSGASVAGAGDINGDGRADLAIGAYVADNNARADSGSTYVIYGQAAPTTIDLSSLGTRGFRIDGAAAGDFSGISVTGAGDINGDGRADLAIGASRADNNARIGSGSTYVIYGQAAPTTIDLSSLGTRGFRIDGAAVGDFSGHSVTGAGDINSDGRADLAIGAPTAGNNARADSGSTYVIYGQAAATNMDLATLGTRGFRIDGAAAGDFSGHSVTGAGDINSDGRADLAIGAYAADNNGRALSGSTYVIFGQAATTNLDLNSLGAAGFRIDGAAEIDRSGISVAGVGDINADGRADLAIGAYSADNNGRDSSGSTYVIYGQATPTNINLATLGTRGFRVDGAGVDDNSGISVAGVGDINADGRADLAIGAYLADNNGRDSSGSTYVIYGQATPTNMDLAALGTRGFRIDGAGVDDNSGISVAGVGDINADGRADLAIGAYFAGNNGRAFSGSTYLVYGFGVASLSYPTITATVGRPMTPSSPTVARTGTAVFASTTLPLGLTVDPVGGTIQGTPLVSGRLVSGVTMTDLTGASRTLVAIAVRRCTVTRTGNNRKNTIRGDQNSDNIIGRGGNDVLLGKANEDCIAGGLGNDTIAGGPAFDTLSGGPGNDTILGGSGSDTIKAGPGRDVVTAGKGDDTITARDGARDTINCGPGTDTATIDQRDTTTRCEIARRR